MKKIIEVVVCMNKKEEAKKLAWQFLELGFEIRIHVCQSINEFMNCISKHKIDCFVFDCDYSKFNPLSMAEKLKKTPSFCHSSIIFVGDMSLLMNTPAVSMVISKPFSKEIYAVSLSDIWQRQLESIIPKDLKVLILDDNPSVLEVIGMHMEQLEHENFVTCRSVQEAKKMISSKEFDLLLLDWDLDDGTCMEIIDMARTQNHSMRMKEALTIVITGRNTVEDIMTLIEMNVKDHIIKPFDYSEFQDKISYAIARHKKRSIRQLLE